MAEILILFLALVFGLIILGGIKFLLSLTSSVVKRVAGVGMYEKTDQQTKAYLAKGFERIDHPEDALEEIDRALSNDPSYKRAYFVKAMILFQIQRYDEAIQSVRKYKEIKKAFVEEKEDLERLKIVEITSLVKLGEKQQANSVYSKALAEDKSIKHRMLAYSKAYFDKGLYGPANDIAFTLIYMSELDWYSSKSDEFYLGQYYLYLGKTLAKMNKKEEAINKLDEGISLLDNRKNAHRYETVRYLYEEKGDILSENNRYTEAIWAYDKCLEIEQYPDILSKKQKILEIQKSKK